MSKFQWVSTGGAGLVPGQRGIPAGTAGGYGDDAAHPLWHRAAGSADQPGAAFVVGGTGAAGLADGGLAAGGQGRCPESAHRGPDSAGNHHEPQMDCGTSGHGQLDQRVQSARRAPPTSKFKKSELTLVLSPFSGLELTFQKVYKHA